MKSLIRIALLCALIAAAGLAAPPALAEYATSQLLEDLETGDGREQARARQLLPLRGVEAAEGLVPLVTHEDRAVAKWSRMILRDLANEAAAPGREDDAHAMTDALLPLLDDGRTEEERRQGLRLLAWCFPEGRDVEPIARLLRDEALREPARQTLERIGTEPALAALRAALTGADSEFQVAILHTIEEARSKEGIDFVAGLMEHDNHAVRAAAASAVAWTGNPEYLAAARSVFEQAPSASRFEAGDALIRLCGAMFERGGAWQLAFNTLAEVLETADDPMLRSTAMLTLGRRGDERAVAPILAALADAPPEVEQNAPAALGALRGPGAARQLAEQYAGEPEAVQLAIIGSLGAMGHPRGMPVLEEAAEHEDSAYRKAALRALAEGEFEGAADILRRAAEEGTEEERAIAKEGLERFGEPSLDAGE